MATRPDDVADEGGRATTMTNGGGGYDGSSPTTSRTRMMMLFVRDPPINLPHPFRPCQWDHLVSSNSLKLCNSPEQSCATLLV